MKTLSRVFAVVCLVALAAFPAAAQQPVVSDAARPTPPGPPPVGDPEITSRLPVPIDPAILEEREKALATSSLIDPAVEDAKGKPVVTLMRGAKPLDDPNIVQREDPNGPFAPDVIMAQPSARDQEIYERAMAEKAAAQQEEQSIKVTKSNVDLGLLEVSNVTGIPYAELRKKSSKEIIDIYIANAKALKVNVYVRNPETDEMELKARGLEPGDEPPPSWPPPSMPPSVDDAAPVAPPPGP